MPVSPTYPGVYIEEIPSGVRTIMGVSTSTTAFVGRAKKGPVNEPILIHNFGDFVRIFGGLWEKSTMSFAVQQYFGNGGKDAVIVRVTSDSKDKKITTKSAVVKLPSSKAAKIKELVLEAKSPGEWGNNLKAAIDYDTKDKDDIIKKEGEKFFNLTIMDPGPSEEGTGTGEIEIIRNLSLNPFAPSYVKKFLEQNSKFVRVSGETKELPDIRPDKIDAKKPVKFEEGNDGADIIDTDLISDDKKGKKGIYALEDADIFNLLCIPPRTFEKDFEEKIRISIYDKAANYCKDAEPCC